MSAASRLRSFLLTILRRGEVARDAVEEVQFHVDAYAADLVVKGLPPEEAARRAKAELGPVNTQGERHRESIGLRAWDEVWSDVRFSLRSLARNRGFAVIAVLSLALGVGVTTAMFSVIYAVVIDAYPYADHERTVNPIVRDVARPQDWDWFALTQSQYEIYRKTKSFEDTVGVVNLNTQLDEGDALSMLRIAALTPNASSFFRVPALLGRPIEQQDGDLGSGQHDVAVLGYKYWLTKYGGDKNVLHRRLRIGSASYEIVGVMPPRFTLNRADVYVPTTSTLAQDHPYFIAFAKIRRGVTPEQASAEVDPMVHDFAKENPRMYPKEFHTRLQLLIDPVTKGTGGSSGLAHTFPLLFLAVFMLLLIGCVNCSILLMARGTTRAGEFAVRAAVGASRSRLVRQLLVECLTISLLGSALGLALSYYLARLPLQLAPDLFPSEAVIRVNGVILAFSTAVAFLAGILSGLLPALRFSRPDIARTIQATGSRTVSSGGRRSLRFMIAGQIALTVVLLTVAGAAITGFLHLTKLNLGYDPTNATVAGVGYPKGAVKTWQERAVLSEQLRQRIAAVPGVESVAFADDTPPSGGGTLPFEIVGSASPRQTQARLTEVGNSYFSTLDIPLLEGRLWTDAEQADGLPRAVVNQAFVRRFSPNRSIVGRTLRVQLPPTSGLGVTFSPAAKDGLVVEIVGMSQDAINDGLDKPVLPNIYADYTCLLAGGASFLVRTHGDPASYTRSIQRALRANGLKPFVWISPYTLQELVALEPVWRQQRLIAAIFGIFAAVALSLALVGLYSVVAYVVAQRTHEFGIRMALGAQRSHILGLVLRSHTLVILGGSAAGVLFSLLLRTQFARWSEASSRDPSIVAGAAALLIIAAYLATFVPARRAAHVEPSRSLRSE